MDIGWNFRREHLPLEQRSHYVITDGGDQPNVVPRTASVWYYFRQTTYPEDQGAVEDRRRHGQGRGDDDRDRAACHRKCWAAPGRSTSTRPIAETTFANIQKVGMPAWSDADQTLAKALQKELGSREQGLTFEGP